MFLDYRYNYFGRFRSHVLTISYPFQWFADAPYRYFGNFKQYMSLHSTLLKENERLRDKQFELETKLQKFTSLEIENKQLKELLNSSAQTEKGKIVAEIMRVEPDPFTQRVFVNKGTQHGVKTGLPVIDAQGIFGIVTDVGLKSSGILLLTDSSYGIPVEISRNGVRGIVNGIGKIDQIIMQHMPKNTDIKVGDSILTSGLGGKYPRGYPVGTVESVLLNPGDAFAKITIKPSAKLQSSRKVLLLDELGNISAN